MRSRRVLSALISSIVLMITFFAVASAPSAFGDSNCSWSGVNPDELYGTGGNDTCQGQDTHEDAYMLGGDDTYSALQGSDYMEGNGGSDELHGNSGNDYIKGGDGNDALYDGPGVDYIDGGQGYNTWYKCMGDGTDTVVNIDNTIPVSC